MDSCEPVQHGKVSCGLENGKRHEREKGGRTMGIWEGGNMVSSMIIFTLSAIDGCNSLFIAIIIKTILH